MVPPFVNPCDYGEAEPCGVNPSFSYTRYPCDFDDPRPADTRGLPLTTDNITPVKGEVVNRQRESILAIESELGIQPSGTFTTVRARLDSFEGVLCAIWDNLGGVGSLTNISLNGTTIVTGVRDINFTGTGVSVVDGGSNRADISISGGTIEQYICNVTGYMPVHVALNVTVPGQQIFTLPDVPYNELVVLFVSGIKQEIGDYIISSNQLEWLGEELILGDIVEVFYTVYNGQGDGYEPVHVAIPVDSDDQTIFTLDESPWGDLALLFIEGVKQEIGDYTVSGDTVTWLSSVPLVSGDVIELLYFRLISGNDCGTSSTLNILDEGIVVETNVENIDFQGLGVSAVGDGLGTVTVTVNGTGSSTIMHQEVFTATIGQTNFVLSFAPISQQATELFINGMSQTIVTDYTLSGSTVTYSGSIGLVGGEEVVVKYFEDLSVTTNPGLPIVLSTDNSTGGNNINFGNSTRGVNVLDPVNAQDIATKNYVDSIGFQSLSEVLAVGNSADGYDINLGLTSRIINVLDPVNPQDVATKNYVDSISLPTLSEVLAISNLADGYDIDLGLASRVINVLDPINAQDVATKNYVDSIGLSTVLSIDNSSDGYSILMTGNSSVQSQDVSGVTESLTIRTGDSVTADVGLLTLRGGNTLGNATAGSVAISGGNAPIGELNSIGGSVGLTGGIGGLIGGNVYITAGSSNTSTVGSIGGSVVIHAGDGETAGSIIADINGELSPTDGYFAVLNNNGTGLLIGNNAIETAQHNYALIWDQDGYNKYIPFPTLPGYLGVDVYVNSLSDLPTPSGNIITLNPNTVYGINGSINIGSNVLVASTGTKIVGGGGTSTNSAIISTSASPVLTIAALGITVQGLEIQNLSGGPSINITTGSDNYSIIDTKVITSNIAGAPIWINNPGMGQIIDSVIYVPQYGFGILVGDDLTSLLVKNTKFKGVGTGTGVYLNSAISTSTVSQLSIDGCKFEDLEISISQNSNIVINGNLAVINCFGTNISAFLNIDIGAAVQSSVVSNNSIWNCPLFNIGLIPGGNHVFRGNLVQGIAQTESPIV
jgi:hypothetical protein